jgi:hypothetical protein
MTSVPKDSQRRYSQHCLSHSESDCETAYHVIVTASGIPMAFNPFQIGLRKPPIPESVREHEPPADRFEHSDSSGSERYLYGRLVTLTDSHPSRGSNLYELPSECDLECLLSDTAFTGPFTGPQFTSRGVMEEARKERTRKRNIRRVYSKKTRNV